MALFTVESWLIVISSQYNDGTRITIPVEESELISIESLIPELASYYTLPVFWNGRQMPQQDFMEGALFIEEWHGLQIGVFQYYQKPDINFYGLLLSHYGLPSIENCLPEERFRGGLQVKINVLDAPELRLVLPSRKEVVYNHFFAQVEDHCKTVIYRYLAQHGEHCLSFAHHTEAAKRGISLPPAKPQLTEYRPRIGDQENLQSVPIMLPLQNDKKYLIVDCEEEAPMEQIFARSFNKSYPNSVLVSCNDEMKGYQWYDELPRITDMNIRVHFEEESHLIYQVPEEMLKKTVTAVNVMLEITENEQVEKVTIPSDIGFWCGETVYYDLSAVDFFVPQGSEITVEELSDLLYQSYFCFSDDSSADSYETQSNEFEDEAEYTAIHALKTGQEATEQRIKMYLERNLLWMIPRDEKVTISIENLNIDVKFS